MPQGNKAQQEATSNDAALMHQRLAHQENDSSHLPSLIERMEDNDKSLSQSSLVEIYDMISKEKGKAAASSSTSAKATNIFDEYGNHL